jgi:hypothetical protein
MSKVVWPWSRQMRVVVRFAFFNGQIILSVESCSSMMNNNPSYNLGPTL